MIIELGFIRQFCERPYKPKIHTEERICMNNEENPENKNNLAEVILLEFEIHWKIRVTCVFLCQQQKTKRLVEQNDDSRDAKI